MQRVVNPTVTEKPYCKYVDPTLSHDLFFLSKNALAYDDCRNTPNKNRARDERKAHRRQGV